MHSLKLTSVLNGNKNRVYENYFNGLSLSKRFVMARCVEWLITH
ncbi:MAG: hypothetical protein ACJAWS_001341 [Oleiphilaceae bacterium]|jgi:hypothetical protein